MLYQIYEAQRSLMEPFADFAQAASKLYSNPLSPFGQNPFAQRMSAGYDLMYRLGKDYEKPEFGIKTVEVDGADVVIQEARRARQAVLRAAPLQALHRRAGHAGQAEGPARRAGRGAAVGPLRHAAARHRAQPAADHKVYITDWKNARMVPLERRRVPPGRLRQLRAGLHPPPAGPLRQLPRDQRVPAHRAGAGGRVADGSPRRGDAADDDHDGRPDRRPQVAHRGEQPGDEQELRVVREQRDLPRADQLPGRRPPRVPGLPAAHRLRGDEPRPPRSRATTTTSST